MISGLKDKTILLTGGTGSFGSRFIKMLLEETDVKAVRSFSRDEHKNQALLDRFGKGRFDVRVGDIRDKTRVEQALVNVDWVVHAAALKQVPMGELEPFEFIRTNIEGTRNLIEASINSPTVSKVLLVSTDKAVNPINLYGCTKMVAEKMMLMAHMFAGNKKIAFSCTRYGNVVGARSTVIPLFLSLKEHEPTPITDPEATRFWITLKQANEFILNVLLDMQGNDIYVPKLPASNVLNIASAIRPNSPIKLVGLRKGDKKAEELVSSNECFDDIYVGYMEAFRVHDKGKRTGYSYNSHVARQMLIPEIKELIGNIVQTDNIYAPVI